MMHQDVLYMQMQQKQQLLLQLHKDGVNDIKGLHVTAADQCCELPYVEP